MKNRKLAAETVMAVLIAGIGVAHAGDTGAIRGTVLFKGNAAKFTRKKIPTGKDPACARAKKKIGEWKVIINKTEPLTLRNVLVSIKDGLGNKVYPVPAKPVVLNQFGCEYTPHVLGVMEGQPLQILNGDNTNHNIHFQPKINEAYNFTQPKKDVKVGRTLTLEEEAPFFVKCDVHTWMGCHIAVFKHPFFAVTGKKGTFKLDGLPPGQYTLEAWHEKFGAITAQVELGEGESKIVEFSFAPANKKLQGATIKASEESSPATDPKDGQGAAPGKHGAPNPAAPAELSQFAFLLGSWRCEEKSKNAAGEWQTLKANWDARYILDGYVIADEYRTLGPDGTLIRLGATYRSYNADKHKWMMKWHDALKSTWLDLGPDDLGGVQVNGDRITFKHHVDPGGVLRATFADITQQRFTWRGELSLDGGTTWEEVMVIEAQRVQP